MKLPNVVPSGCVLHCEIFTCQINSDLSWKSEKWSNKVTNGVTKWLIGCLRPDGAQVKIFTWGKVVPNAFLAENVSTSR